MRHLDGRDARGVLAGDQRRLQGLDADDDQLAAQLGSIKWTVDSRGRIKIESKDDMRKRGLPSPDRADAVVYCWVSMGSATIDVQSYKGEALTGDLLDKAW